MEDRENMYRKNSWIYLDAVLTDIKICNVPFQQALYVLDKKDKYVIIYEVKCYMRDNIYIGNTQQT